MVKNLTADSYKVKKHALKFVFNWKNKTYGIYWRQSQKMELLSYDKFWKPEALAQAGWLKIENRIDFQEFLACLKGVCLFRRL